MRDIDDSGLVPATGARQDDPDGTAIVVLCTANVCRSPMAAALLTRQLSELGVTARVRSAGMLPGGEPPLPEVISVMARRGLCLTAHRSRMADAAELAGASLVLAMARDHLRYAVVAEPGTWPRAFTLLELIRRGERIGPRAPGEPLTDWLSRLHAGRERAALLGHSADDDVPDPAGGPVRAYADVADLLDRSVARLADLGWAHAGPHG
jgi:protein-tyrosine phosphatase